MSAIRLTGTLARDARATTQPNGDAWLHVDVGQAGGSVAAVARLRMGNGYTAQMAAGHKARRCRRGARITVHCNSFEIMLSPVPHLVLTNVELIEELQVHHHNETTHSEAA